MEGFTLVLLIGWLLMLGIFVAMYFMEQATKKVSQSRANQSEQTPEKNR